MTRKYYTRRSVVKGIGATVVASSLAGCSSGGTDGPTPPADDENPKSLIPDAPNGWEKTDEQEQMAGIVGAEAGWGASYDDPDGNHYGVEILRWSSRNDAKDSRGEVYDSGWPIYVIQGNFGFAAKGADVDNAVSLLANSPTLTKEYITQNNANE